MAKKMILNNEITKFSNNLNLYLNLNAFLRENANIAEPHITKFKQKNKSDIIFVDKYGKAIKYLNNSSDISAFQGHTEEISDLIQKLHKNNEERIYSSEIKNNIVLSAYYLNIKDVFSGIMLFKTNLKDIAFENPYIGSTAFFVSTGLLLLFLVITLINNKISNNRLQDIKNKLLLIDLKKSIQTKSNLDIYDELEHEIDILSSKLKSVEDNKLNFVSNVSHELKSPLTNIKGYIQLLIDIKLDDGAQKEYLNIILNEVNRISNLINSLIKLSKLDENEEKLVKEAFDLNEITRQSLIPFINRIEEKNLSFIDNICSEKLVVFADKQQIIQTISNLVDNAIKYTQKHGKISIQTFKENNKAVFVIQDNGIGISNEDLKHIFDRFYVAKKSRTDVSSTGLGLSICKKIIEMHDEEIKVKSEFGRGTEFKFQLKLNEVSDRNDS